jgi:hypothetical protein
MTNFAGGNASYCCDGCGLELNGEEVGEVAAGDNKANGEFAPCPKCHKQNSIDRDNQDD